MPRKPEDLTGQRFGSLTVASFYASSPPRWYCECDCGGSTIARAKDLKSGHTYGCGCNRRGRTSLELAISRLQFYPGIMVLVARDRGPSSAHPCARCGAQAKRWVSDGACEKTRRTLVGRDIYSWCSHPEHYVPTCYRCSGTYVRHLERWEHADDFGGVEAMPRVTQPKKRSYDPRNGPAFVRFEDSHKQRDPWKAPRP